MMKLLRDHLFENFNLKLLKGKTFILIMVENTRV